MFKRKFHNCVASLEIQRENNDLNLMLCTDKMQIDGSDIHLSQLLTKFICDSGQDTNLKLLRRTNEIKPIHVQTHKLTIYFDPQNLIILKIFSYKFMFMLILSLVFKNILIMNIGYIVIMKSKISLTHKLNEIKMISTFLYIISLYSMPGKVDTCIIKFWQFYTLGEFLYQLKIV